MGAPISVMKTIASNVAPRFFALSKIYRGRHRLTFSDKRLKSRQKRAGPNFFGRLWTMNWW